MAAATMVRVPEAERSDCATKKIPEVETKPNYQGKICHEMF